VNTYVDALAALVPSEVLTLHALILSVTTQTTAAGTSITDLRTLKYAFYGLLVLSIVLYLVSRMRTGGWEAWDYARAAIPPISFLGWTMLQRATAFDAICKDCMTDAARTVIGLFLAVLLGLLATYLAAKADAKKP
jgi:hypothetical protein